MRERILAVDYGRKRIGLASCDPLWISAQPLPTLQGEPAAAIAPIAALCAEREVRRIVVGLPLHMDGSDSDMAKEARAFGGRLAAATGLPVEYFDERLTSFAAEEQLRGVKRGLKKKKGLIDAAAALQILRDWMAAHGAG